MNLPSKATKAVSKPESQPIAKDPARELAASQAIVSALSARLEQFALDTKDRTDRVSSQSIREEALALLAIAKNGPRDDYYSKLHDSCYEADKRWSDRGPISQAQRMDRAELHAGVPLSRHAWLQELRDRAQLDEQASLRRPVVFGAMLTRMNELTSAPQRDIELEQATVEMGFRFSASTDSDGNPFSFVHVRANEAYKSVFRHGELADYQKTAAVGVGHIYSLYQLGESIGYTGEDAERWYVSYRAEGTSMDVPFDAITEVVDDCASHGSLVEYPTFA